MSKTIEQDAKKSMKRQKAAKIIAVVAAVLLVGWTIYSVVMNLNQKERFVLNSFIKYYRELDAPASYALKDCSKLYESITAAGEPFQYVIIEVEHAGKSEYLLLIADGAGEGTVYKEQLRDKLDCSDTQAIRFEIQERDEDIHLKKLQNTLTRYWQFHDVD